MPESPPICQECGAYIASPIHHAQWHENIRTAVHGLLALCNLLKGTIIE